ncbi:MAG: ribonuclease H-like domain-containing protein [candidate division NC10 bacterium]
MPTLDDLRRVIRRIETARPPHAAPRPAEEILGGELHDTGQGQVLVVRREFPLSHRHGRYALGAAFEAPLDLLSAAARAEAPVGDPRGLLFLDTETTGLAGGTGTYAFLVGAGWLEGDRLVLAQYFMRDFDDEPALLEALGPLFERASGIVTFNGAGFDLPLLETRFVLARRRWPQGLAHLDLLRPSRRVWTARFDDCRLATLEREVLGLEREDDVPGALIPALYFDFLRSRRAAPLVRVFAHNRDDILSLVGLLGWFGRALAVHDHLDAEELAGLGRLWEPADLDRALACYRAALAAGLAGALAQWVRLRLAAWEKRSARWEAARGLWEEASRHEAFDPRPWEELAKFHEHRRRDFATARAIVERALDLAGAASAPTSVLDAFAHRRSRLTRRLAARG